MNKIGSVRYLIREYDEALEFFLDKLGFVVVKDEQKHEGDRFILVSPRRSAGCSLLLSRASTDEDLRLLGKQGGDGVFLFLETNKFDEDFDRMKSSGVEFTETARHMPYGTVAIFRDIYGNLWDLFEPALD